MTEVIIITCILLVAHIVDGFIRKRLYVKDVSLARLQAKKEFGIKSESFENVMNQGWQNMVNTNHFRYGITGEFDYEIRPTDVYETTGEQTFVGTGVILDKKFVTRGDIVDDMAAFAQTGKKFVADPDELRDRHIVIMYIQNNMQQFVWEDKGLFDNVDKGEKVSVRYDDKGPLLVGYKVKGV